MTRTAGIAICSKQENILHSLIYFYIVTYFMKAASSSSRELNTKWKIATYGTDSSISSTYMYLFYDYPFSASSPTFNWWNVTELSSNVY